MPFKGVEVQVLSAAHIAQQDNQCYDEYMRRLLPVLLLLLAIPFLFARATFASSSQAYQDYGFQFDQYRQKLSDFQVAYKQYQQFNSLSSQQDAIDKVKLLLAQRNQVAKTYFLFLNEKLNENPGLGTSDALPYRTLLTNQIGLLDQNTAQSSSIGSLDDASKISTLFIKNYNAMQSAYRQTILGLDLGYLQYFGSQFDAAASRAQSLIAANKGDASPEKQATLDRWLLALSNKHSLFEQQATTIRTALTKFEGDVEEQDRQFTTIQKTMTQAKQNLVEGTSYLGEVESALQYE